jgi:hypothetical protein
MMTLREEFQDFANDYLKLAERADSPEMRKLFLGKAREWLQAADEQGLGSADLQRRASTWTRMTRSSPDLGTPRGAKRLGGAHGGR